MSSWSETSGGLARKLPGTTPDTNVQIHPRGYPLLAKEVELTKQSPRLHDLTHDPPAQGPTGPPAYTPDPEISEMRVYRGRGCTQDPQGPVNRWFAQACPHAGACPKPAPPWPNTTGKLSLRHIKVSKCRSAGPPSEAEPVDAVRPNGRIGPQTT